MPALIPALIIGAAGIGGAAISASASNHASNVAANAASQNDALDQATYDSNKALIEPAVDRGNAAGDELQGFLGLGSDPAASQAAFNTYLGSTGYQFTKQQGIDAAKQGATSEGLYNSGAAEKALDTYGSGVAQQYGQQYASDLSGVANTGEVAVNALTGAATTNAASQSANNNSAATVSANAGLAGSAQVNSLIGNAFGAYALTRGQSSFGGAASGGSSGINAFAGG